MGRAQTADYIFHFPMSVKVLVVDRVFEFTSCSYLAPGDTRTPPATLKGQPVA